MAVISDMNLANPTWIKNYLYPYKTYSEVPESLFKEINQNLNNVQSSDPLVTVVVIAWNEEVNILQCVATLANQISTFPFEIVVVDNNSKDKTSEALSRLHVRHFLELAQGAGPARQKGQENAIGKYILTADADCFYPPSWVEEMTKTLIKENTVCVYGRYSFISSSEYPRWKLFTLEKCKDLMAEIRHIKQPYFNTFGISMGYIKELGLKIGFIKINRRGEDGQLCLELMKYGKIRQVRSAKARVWTGVRTLSKDGSFWTMFGSRIVVELRRIKYNFVRRTKH